jgi:hypothetical protein
MSLFLLILSLLWCLTAIILAFVLSWHWVFIMNVLLCLINGLLILFIFMHILVHRDWRSFLKFITLLIVLFQIILLCTDNFELFGFQVKGWFLDVLIPWSKLMSKFWIGYLIVVLTMLLIRMSNSFLLGICWHDIICLFITFRLSFICILFNFWVLFLFIVLILTLCFLLLNLFLCLIFGYWFLNL